jgi:DNA-binding Xre family transcriptional regulator
MEQQKDYNRLKVVLAEKKKSNKWLAETLEVTETTVARWTNNRQQPDLPMLYRIAKLLEVAPCDLLEKGAEIQ